MTRSQSNLLNSIETLIKSNVPNDQKQNEIINVLLDLASNIEKLNEKNDDLELELLNCKTSLEQYRVKSSTLTRTIKFLVDNIAEV